MECLCHKSLRPQCVNRMTMEIDTLLPSYQSVIDALTEAERSDGWLNHCIEQNVYLMLNQEFITFLTDFLQGLGCRIIVEVCAGRGELASGLTANGLEVIATDAHPAPDANVINLPAGKALETFKPDTVLGCFVPHDTGVDEKVLGCSPVKHYIVVNVRLGGLVGSSTLWRHPQWKVEFVPQVARWMVSRHDVWLGNNHKILTHGEVWHLYRRKS